MWYFALSAVIVCLLSAATAKLALAMVPATGLPTFLVSGVWLYGGGGANGLGVATGILSFVLAAAGLYAGLALLHEDARGHTVLPTLRRGAMRNAFVADFDGQLEGLEHEAGVRRYL